MTERHITHLVNSEPARPLPAAKYLLALARKAQKGTYVSQEGKSAYQLFVDFLELAENFADDVGLDADETKEKNEAAAKLAKEKEDANGEGQNEQVALMRFEGAPVPIEEFNAQKAKEKQQVNAEPYDRDTDAADASRLDIEKIVMQDGLEIYKDQAGRLWSGLATFWIKRGEFEQASATFEKGLASVVTIRDFTQIFDAYAEFSETVISTLMTAISDPDSEEDDEGLAEMETDLDKRMKDFEDLMDRRPFLMNEVLLRRNPNEVVEWEKRIALWGDDDEKVSIVDKKDPKFYILNDVAFLMQVVETYTKAIETINPRKAVGPLYPIYVNFAKFYEEGGSIDAETGEPRNEPDLEQARQIFEKGTRVPYKTVDELAEIWCEFAELELRAE
jgi:pre-mRNA-splicing factor SYF1